MAEGGAAIALLGGEPAPLWRLSRASRWASPWPERPGRGAARSGKYSGHRPEADAGGRVRRDLSAHPLRESSLCRPAKPDRLRRPDPVRPEMRPSVAAEENLMAATVWYEKDADPSLIAGR